MSQEKSKYGIGDPNRRQKRHDQDMKLTQVFCVLGILNFLRNRNHFKDVPKDYFDLLVKVVKLYNSKRNGLADFSGKGDDWEIWVVSQRGLLGWM